MKTVLRFIGLNAVYFLVGLVVLGGMCTAFFYSMSYLSNNPPPPVEAFTKAIALIACVVFGIYTLGQCWIIGKEIVTGIFKRFE